MSLRATALTLFVKKEDVQCPICFDIIKEPCTPAHESRSIRTFWKTVDTAVCSRPHSYCKEHFAVIHTQVCPMCRIPFTKIIPNPEMAQKVDQYVWQKFHVSSDEYFQEGRLTRPTLKNAQIWISIGDYKMGFEIINNLPSNLKRAGYLLFIEHCKESKNLDDLYAFLNKLPVDLRIKTVDFLIEEYGKICNLTKVITLTDTYPKSLERISTPLLKRIALYYVERESATKLEDLEKARVILDAFFIKLPDPTIKDEIISSIATQYYILGYPKKAEEEFLKLTSGALFAGALFIKLFDGSIKRCDAVLAQKLLNKMGLNWSSPEAGLIDRIEEIKKAQIMEPYASVSKTNVVRLLVFGSIALFFGMLIIKMNSSVNQN